jgi:hypothetical protein
LGGKIPDVLDNQIARLLVENGCMPKYNRGEHGAQTFMGVDGLMEMVELKTEGYSILLNASPL